MSASCLFDRRGFIAAGATVGLVGCKADGLQPVRLIFGSGAGVGSLSIAHLFVRSLHKLGVGATVESVPRGGGKLAAQMLAAAPRDGTVIAQLPSGLIYAQIVGEEGANFDLARFEWIGSYAFDRRALVVSAKSGVTRFEQLLERSSPITIPARSTGPAYYEAAIIRHLTGAMIKTVPGIAGSSRIALVMSGQADGAIGALDSLAELLDVPGMNILLRVNDVPLPAGLPDRLVGSVPALRDLARGPDRTLLLQLVDAHAQLGRLLALPPGTPAEIVALWRQRFGAVLADPDFRRDVAKLRFELHNQPGAWLDAQLTELSRQAGQTKPAIRRAIDS